MQDKAHATRAFVRPRLWHRKPYRRSLMRLPLERALTLQVLKPRIIETTSTFHVLTQSSRWISSVPLPLAHSLAVPPQMPGQLLEKISAVFISECGFSVNGQVAGLEGVVIGSVDETALWSS